MAQYLNYILEDGSVLLVEVCEDQPIGVVPASPFTDSVQKAKESFASAMENVRVSLKQMQAKFQDLSADEVEIKFGLKATGELGNNLFAVAKTNVEANYEVRLSWKKPATGTGAIKKKRKKNFN